MFLLTLLGDLEVWSPGCEYGDDFQKEYGALLSSTTGSKA